MAIGKIIHQLDRWGTILLIYLIPWQARLIFSQGFLAGAPSEPQTRSLFAVELVIVFMVAVRLVAMKIEKDTVIRNRCYAIKPIGRILFSFACLAALAFLSVVVSVDQATTVFAALHLLLGLAIFFLIVTAPSEREARLAFLVAALVQAAIAIMQVIFQHVYPSVWLGVAAHYPEVAGTSVVEAAGMRFLRAYGTLPHPNILGGMMVVAIMGSRPLFRRFTIYNVGVYLLLATGLFFSFSRVAWLAFVVGVFAQWVWARRDRVFQKNIAVCAAAMVILALAFVPFVAARLGASGRLETMSLVARSSSIKDALALIRTSPLSGVGAGAFTAAVHSAVDPGRNGYGLEPAHSVFVEVFAETGLFAFLLFIWLLYLLTVIAWRSGKVGLAASLLVMAIFDHWGWSTFAGIIIFWVGWGFTIRGTCYAGVIQKAGAIILSEKDPRKMLVLYRTGPNYNDWTIPKGHMEPGESREDTTYREIKEETGLEIKIISILPDRDYVTGHDHPAVVHFFLARSLDDSKLRLEPGFPKNRLEWIPIEKGEAILTFDNMKEYFRRILPEIEKEADRLKNK